MPTKSTQTPSTKSKRPKLKDDEDAYVEWLHSPEGQQAEDEARAKRRGRPVIIVDTPLTPTEMRDVMRKTGASLRMMKGFTQKPSDPSIIQGILDRAAEKATQAISIRIPVADLEAAKRLAEKTGLGYQTILKDLIHEGLQRAL